jgi:hypothetical protein
LYSDIKNNEIFTSLNNETGKQQVEVNSFNGNGLIFYILGICFYHRKWLIRI